MSKNDSQNRLAFIGNLTNIKDMSSRCTIPFSYKVEVFANWGIYKENKTTYFAQKSNVGCLTKRIIHEIQLKY